MIGEINLSYKKILRELIECENILSVALGGSRSRGEERDNSDYDLFCVINNEDFKVFRSNFRVFLESIPSIVYAAEVFYLEHWGYLFKAVDLNGICFDISIIPENRINEMSIRSTNIVLKDTNGLYQFYVDNADDRLYFVSNLENQRFYDYCALFGFEKNRFNKAAETSDYWYAVRCLERMKNYLIRCDRIQNKNYSKTQSCPERGYDDINDFMKKIYVINGNMESLICTSKEICNLFDIIVHDEKMRNRSKIICR